MGLSVSGLNVPKTPCTFIIKTRHLNALNIYIYIYILMSISYYTNTHTHTHTHTHLRVAKTPFTLPLRRGGAMWAFGV